MAIPEHYIHIQGPLYMDPEARDMGLDIPDTLPREWLMSATDALNALSTDIPTWRARTKNPCRLSLRFQLNESFVDETIFDHDALPDDAESPLADFVDAVTKANADGALWSDSENHLAGDIAARLAERSTDHILRFVRFLESNDLDHEVSQAWHIERVIQAHGWRPETMALWVARMGTCAGQHGHETDWAEHCDQPLSEFVASKPEHRTLLVELMGGNMVADQGPLNRDVEHHLSVLTNDTIDIFWSDLERQGLNDMAGPILDGARQWAQELIRNYAGGRKAPPHWLSPLGID